MTHRVVCLLPILAAFLLLSPAPSSAGSRRTQETPAQPAQLVWPLPPDPPRIRYVGSLEGSAAFDRKPGRMRRFLLGPRADRTVALGKPYGVTTDGSGKVYVADSANGTVMVFDQIGKQVRVLGQKGRVHLVTPIGVALDRQGRLFVSDAGLRQVVAFDDSGEVTLALGAGQGIDNPAGLAMDTARDRLYVADSHAHRIALFSSDGNPLGTWGSRGNGDGQFNFPTNVALDREGTVYVVDTGNFRVQIFDADGKFLSKFGEAGDGFGRFHRPKGIGVDSEGHIYVSDAAFNNFQIFDRQGRLLLFAGTYGTGPGNFWLPAGLHVDRADRIYVADQVNARVQVFEYIRQGETPPAADRNAPAPAAPGSP